MPPPAEIHITLNRIARKVKVNRNRTPQESLDATGRAQYTDRKVVNAMPKGEGEEVEVVFFKPDLSQHNDFISDDDLEKEFELRGLKPADPVSVAAVNEADPAFADEKPHGTHWKDAKGNWFYATFDRWFVKRKVVVSRYGGDWGGRLVVCGRSQLSSFLSLFLGRVLFCKLSVPPAEHSPSLIQLYGKSDIFLIVKRFCFPEYQKKYAQCVRFLDRGTNIRMFLCRREKTGG